MKQFRALLAIGLVLVMSAAACSSKKNGSLVSPAASKDPTIAAEVPADIVAKGTLTVATDASYAPDEFFAADNKTIQGMDVDLGNAIATVLGLKFTFVNASFPAIIPALKSGKYDLSMSSFTDNKEREKVVDFVTYYQAGASIFVASSTTDSFATLDQLCGKTVSVEAGTTEIDDAKAGSTACVKAGKPAIDYKIFPDQNATNLAVVSGRAVASLADSQVAAYQVKLTGGKVKVTGDYLAPAPYGIAIPRPSGVAPGSAPLSKAILDAVKKLISTGVYKQILDKWGIAAGAIAEPQINGAQ